MRRKEKPSILVFVFCVGICATPNLVYAQDSHADLPDSPSAAAVAKPGSEADREVSWQSLPKDFLHDQKNIWLFPTQLAKGRHWLPTLAVVGGTAGLIAADPHAMPYFRRHSRNLDDVNDVFDAPITTGEVIAVPASLLVAGYMRHDTYQVSTALLAGEAYADSAVVDLAIKAVTRRKRPSDVPPGASFNDTFFSGDKSPFKGSSFPSGHAAGVFSVATVVATRYHNHRWVPWGIVCFCDSYQLFSRNYACSFPVRRVSGSSSRLHDHTLPSAVPVLKHCWDSWPGHESGLSRIVGYSEAIVSWRNMAIALIGEHTSQGPGTSDSMG